MNNILKTVGKLALPILLVAMFSPISVPAEDRVGDKKLEGRWPQRTQTATKNWKGHGTTQGRE